MYKNNILKDLDLRKYIKRLILLGWISLGVCAIIKFAGFDVFKINPTEGTFYKICQYTDTHVWANYLVSAAYCALSMRFFLLAILQRMHFKKWEHAVFIITVLVGTALKLWSFEWGWVYDIWQAILMPMLFLNKDFKKYLNIFYANIAVIVFQIISSVIKDASAIVMYENIVIGLIYSLDVLVMTILYCLYSNLNYLKKGGNVNV